MQSCGSVDRIILWYAEKYYSAISYTNRVPDNVKGGIGQRKNGDFFMRGNFENILNLD